MDVHYATQFKKQYRKLPESVRRQFRFRVALFLREPAHPLLHIHKLSGEYGGLWSMNVSGDFRAAFDRGNGIILFVAIGTHSQLYS